MRQNERSEPDVQSILVLRSSRFRARENVSRSCSLNWCLDVEAVWMISCMPPCRRRCLHHQHHHHHHYSNRPIRWCRNRSLQLGGKWTGIKRNYTSKLQSKNRETSTVAFFSFFLVVSSLCLPWLFLAFGSLCLPFLASLVFYSSLW